MKEYTAYQLNRWWSVLYVWQNEWSKKLTWEQFFKIRMKMYMKSLTLPYYHYDLETPDEVEMYNALCHVFKPEQVQVQQLQYVFTSKYPYRLDFAIKPNTVTGTSYTIGIECDNPWGHASATEKEKDQFRTELLQDLYVVKAIVRFEGKAIKSDPIKCAKKALRYYNSIEQQITDELNQELSEYMDWIIEAGTS
ncbi:hypothetical protein [Priestia megaterium]|uniref:hypothetical protein n=1 Tax=Priestia megaterium TaxID=1404 RepID=UPI001C22EEE6|nr:hypothetical protein [Priestia megaterium]MBU8689485.1 hypothetical protein [Priestia megaterium]